MGVWRNPDSFLESNVHIHDIHIFLGDTDIAQGDFLGGVIIDLHNKRDVLCALVTHITPGLTETMATKMFEAESLAGILKDTVDLGCAQRPVLPLAALKHIIIIF